MDAFSWSPKDISGIDPNVMQHHLNIFPKARPMKQKPLKFTPDRQQTISDEVD